MLDEIASVTTSGADVAPLAKLASHREPGILHRAFSIILLDENGHVCLQRRSAKKLLWPLHWSNACCSHPRWGEPFMDAVPRRIEEELGCAAQDLQELFAFRYFARYRDVGVEFEHCHVWLGRIDSREVTPNPDEIDAVAYLAPELVSRGLQAGPEFYTPWFHVEWPMALAKLPPR